MKQLKLKPCSLSVLRALSVMCVAAPMFSHAQTALDIGTVNTSGNGASQMAPVPAAAKIAVSQGSLDARSAESIVSDNYVRNYVAPVGDFSQVLLMTPGAFSYSPNGVGLGNAATTVRGLGDAQYLVTYDGIPFNDTNGVSHHSYVMFPNMAIGGADVVRGPGSAATIGQATFGGSMNLQSRILENQERTSITGSYGSWDTRMFIVEHETGQFGPDGRSNLLFNVQQMNSNGYETYNYQDRQALSFKYRYLVSSSTELTAVESYMDVKNNQLDAGAPTRAQVAQFGPNYLNSNDPTQSNYFGYNLYNVVTSFQYIGIKSDLGNGWKLDDKLYNYGYHNQENIGGAPISPVQNKTDDTGTDKLNSYHTTGNLLRLTQDTAMGTLRTGLWAEYANSDRHQFPSDELSGWQDSPAPKFSETYQTYTLQPYIEYEFKVSDDLKITPGLKYADYRQDFRHLQDLKKVGPLGGTISGDSITGGSPTASNSITYTDLLPSLDAHYMIRPNWSTYVQYAAGDLIPPTSIFDVPPAQWNFATPPKAQKSNTFQFGTDWKSDVFNFDANVYHVKLDNSYSCVVDPANPTTQICAPTGNEITQGLEVESTVVLGGGFSIYANGTVGTTKYSGGTLDGHWIAGAPGDTEKLGLFYEEGGWKSALVAMRVGKLYNDGATPGNNAYTIDPVVLTNLFVNYTVKTPGMFSKQTKLQLAVNNLLNNHAITAISGSASSAAPSAADLITTLPGRSVNLTATFDF